MALNSLNVVPAFASAWLFTFTKEVQETKIKQYFKPQN